MLQNFLNKKNIEAGCDEAGRGCYAGPVFAAAVILPHNFYHPLLNDSKQVKEIDRLILRDYIQTHATNYAIAQVNNVEIDEINILKASIKAMHLALDALHIIPNSLLVDGNRFYSYKQINHQCIIKGDGKYASIAAASILAKTTRDEFMEKIHEEYPMYGWKKNKGYGTLQHRKAIEQFGLTPYHRKSFNILPNQLTLF